MVLHLVLEALLALVGGGDAGLHVGDIDLALVADRLRERAGGDLAAEDVVGGDIGEREVGVAAAGLVVAVADERIDGDDRDAGVHRLTQRLDELGLVGGRDQDGVGMPGDDGVQHRHLLHRVELGRALEDQLRAEGFGRGLRSAVHRDVECIRGQAGDQRDRVGLPCCPGGAGGHAGEQSETGRGHPEFASIHAFCLPDDPARPTFRP